MTISTSPVARKKVSTAMTRFLTSTTKKAIAVSAIETKKGNVTRFACMLHLVIRVCSSSCRTSTLWIQFGRMESGVPDPDFLTVFLSVNWMMSSILPDPKSMSRHPNRFSFTLPLTYLLHSQPPTFSHEASARCLTPKAIAAPSGFLNPRKRKNASAAPTCCPITKKRQRLARTKKKNAPTASARCPTPIKRKKTEDCLTPKMVTGPYRCPTATKMKTKASTRKKAVNQLMMVDLILLLPILVIRQRSLGKKVRTGPLSIMNQTSTMTSPTKKITSCLVALEREPSCIMACLLSTTGILHLYYRRRAFAPLITLASVSTIAKEIR